MVLRLARSFGFEPRVRRIELPLRRGGDLEIASAPAQGQLAPCRQRGLGQYFQVLLLLTMLEKNCVVIVTGAGGSGWGRSISTRFATGGATVVVSDIDEVGSHETVRLIEQGGGCAAFFRSDVRNESQVKDLILFAEITFGGVSVLVNNASAPHGGEEIESWMDSIETDLLGALFATRWAIESMRRGNGGATIEYG
jgi:NADP-dependent 3-hydroxy acid dehydrogenase YdfG